MPATMKISPTLSPARRGNKDAGESHQLKGKPCGRSQEIMCAAKFSFQADKAMAAAETGMVPPFKAITGKFRQLPTQTA